MKINVTWCTEDDSKVAGKTCAKKAVLDLIQTKLAIMFNSNKYNQGEFLKGAKSILGTAPIIGCTSSEGIIVPEGYINPKKNNYAGIMAIGDNDTKVGTAILPKGEDERKTARIVAKQAMDKVGTNNPPTYYLMFVSDGNAEEYAKGIKDVIGDVPCFGGNVVKDNQKIFTEDMILSDGIAVAFIYTNKKIENAFESKYHETVNSGVITETSQDNVLEKIDGIKAMKKYCEWTGNKVREVKEEKMLECSILKPLAVKTVDGSLAVIKQPIYGNNNYSIKLKNKVSVNTAVIQMQISKEELISSPAIVLRQLKKQVKTDTKGIIIFHNYLRKNILDEEQIEKLALRIKEEAKDIPFIVTFTEGEFGKGEYLQNYFASLMLSEIAICN